MTFDDDPPVTSAGELRDLVTISSPQQASSETS